MLAQSGRRRTGSIGFAIDVDTKTDLRNQTSIVIQRVKQSTPLQLRVRCNRINAIDGAGRHTAFCKQRKPVVAAGCDQDCLNTLNN